MLDNKKSNLSTTIFNTKDPHYEGSSLFITLKSPQEIEGSKFLKFVLV